MCDLGCLSDHIPLVGIVPTNILNLQIPRDIHLIEINYCVDTSPTQQAKKARQQRKLPMPPLRKTRNKNHTDEARH